MRYNFLSNKRGTGMEDAEWLFTGTKWRDEEDTPCANRSETDTRVSDVVPLTLAASSLSIVGSSLTIATFLAVREFRKSTVRQIITFLAIADLLTAATYFMAAVSHYHYFTPDGVKKPVERQFLQFCRAQAFLTSYFSVASFFWTAFLPLYFVFPLVFGIYHWRKRVVAVFNLTGWTVPLVICSVASFLGFLGPSQERINNALDWCFVSDDFMTRANSSLEFRTQTAIFFLMQAVCSRIWEFLVYLVTFSCYFMIFIKKCRDKKVICIHFA